MSGKWPGGFITKTAPTVVGPVGGEGGSASGVWTLDQVADYVKQGLWPKPILLKDLYGTGLNDYGQVGDRSTTQRSSPVQVQTVDTWTLENSNWNHSIITRQDGTLWTWGRGDNGVLGQGNTSSLSSRH